MRKIRILTREFIRLAAREGKIAAVIFFPLLVWRRIRGVDVRSNDHSDPAGEAFDQCYGVDTVGVIPNAHLAVSDRNWVHGFGYQAVVPGEFEVLWPSLNIDYKNAVFVDLGAGKGRALMLAAKFPFKRIIGVEIARELVDIASANLRIFASHEHNCTEPEIVCADVASYRLPNDPLVLFLYNPFDAPIMRKVIANLIESLRIRPRPVVIIYIRPELAEMWDLVDGFVVVDAGARLRIYDNRTTLENDASLNSS